MQRCQSQHYHPQAQRALPALTLGLIGEVGQCQGQRWAVLGTCVRGATATASEQPLHTARLATVAPTLAAQEIGIFDAGFKLAALHAAGVQRYGVRLAQNCTARRSTVAP